MSGSSCKSCSNSYFNGTTCLTSGCPGNYVLLNTTCVEMCPLGYLKSSSVCTTPTSCSSSFFTYAITSTITRCMEMCEDGMYISSQSCVTSCPANDIKYQYSIVCTSNSSISNSIAQILPTNYSEFSYQCQYGYFN